MSRLKNRDYPDYVADIHAEIIRIQGLIDGLVKDMAGLRDVVTHNYDGISYDMIW